MGASGGGIACPVKPDPDAAARESLPARAASCSSPACARQGARSKHVATRKAKCEIESLERQVAAAHSQVEVLWQQRHVLGAHAEAAQIAVKQCMALLRLGSLLHERRQRGARQQEEQRQQQEQEQQEQGRQALPICKAPASQDWLAHMAQMEAQLCADAGACTRARSSADGAARPGAGGAQPHSAEAARASGASCRVSWSPERAAEWFGDAGTDLSVAALRRGVRRFVNKAGPLYTKARQGSGFPDTAQALAELAAEKELIMAFCGTLVVTGNGRAMSELLLTPLDQEPADEWPGPGAAGPRAEPAAPRGADWMVWLVNQLEMDAQQEELLFAALQSLEQRTAPGLLHSSQLMSECERHQGDTALLQEIAARASAGLFAYQIMVGVYMLSIFDTILRPDQLAVLYLSAWPWCPSLSGLRQALILLREQRQAQAATGPAQDP